MADEEYEEYLDEDVDPERADGDEIREPLEDALSDDEIDPAEEGFVRGYREEREEEWEEEP